MPLITETYYLSLTQDNRGILRLRCSQDDTLRTVNLKLYNNGSIFVIPSGVSASVSGVKQNGAVFSKPCTISQNRESVVLQLSSDITNVDGIIVAEIVLNDGEGGRLGTSNFIIQVEKNPIRAGVIQDTETPIEYINDFIEKIQTLTARLNNLITPSGDPSLAEVVDARIGILDSTTYQTLGARLNAEFQRLSNALKGITILESTGDTTDRTSEILSKLNAYGICKLGKGDFYVNGLVMPEDSMLVGSGKSTRIILPSSVTSGHVVKPRSNCIIENISFYGGFTGTYSELIASGSSAHRHCIILDRFDSISSENVILNNIFINNFVGSAIIQRYTTGCHCEDIIINMCYAGIDISNVSYDGQFTNVSMEDTRFGIVQNGSNFVFTNCVSKDSAQHIMSDQQNTGCTFSSCSFSEYSLETTTSKLASISNAREGVIFDNCLFDSSLSMLLNACDGIVIKGTNFVGSDTFRIIVSNGRNTLLLITDCIADVEPVVTNAGTAARITSCYLKDGTAWSISEADITVDDELSDESENPVQNKVINREISEIKADLEYATNVERIGLTKSGYYNLGSSITYIDPDGTPSLWGVGICEIVPCVPGDVFIITSKGTAAARNWAFLSSASSNNIISRKTDGTNQYICDNEMVTAPENSAYIVLNANKNETVAIYKGKTLDQKITDTNDRITALGTPFATDSQYATIIPANSDLNSYQTPGNYKITTIAIAQTVTNIPEIVGGRLTVFTGASDTNFAQLYIGSNSNTYIRVYSSNAWQDWNRIDNKALGNPIATDSKVVSNVQSNDNFNNYTTPGNYKVTTFAVAQNVANIPVVLAGRLIVMTTSSNSSPVQIYIANNAACYIRIKVGSDWRAWRYLTDEATEFVLSTLFTSVIADNTDIDTIRTPGNYKVTNIARANTMPNLPEAQGGRLTVLTLGVTGGIHQWYISQSNNWYVRELISDNWSAWKKFTDETYVNQTVENAFENLTATKSAYNMFKILANQSDYNIGFANAFVPITLKSYLGNNQNVHPKVLYFENGFSGHKYWMGYTPYPYSNDDVENPCVAYSDDGINFTNINGNPLDNPGGDGYDSDIHLVYRNDTETLEAWFRYVGDASLEVREETIYRRTTTDGVTWTAKEKIYSNETGVISKLLSPAIEWDGTKYCIWVVRDGVAIDYYEAPGTNPTSWTLIRSITLTFVDDGLTVKAWHMDAIKDGNQYILLIMCRNGTGIDNNRCSLFISTSNDNINYSNPVKVVGGADSWDRYMYRSSIVKVGDKYRIYYSAGSGGTTTIYSGAVWGIGITESDSLERFIGLYY